MVVVIALIPFKPFTLAFYILYGIGGLTDLMDGLVARKTHNVSKTGAVLDSIADLLFLLVAVIKLAPVVYAVLPKGLYFIILGIAVIKIIAYGVGIWRFHRFVALHTLLNKVTGGVLFLLPYFLEVQCFQALLIGVTIIATGAAVEELLCQSFMKDYNPDVRTLFELKNNEIE